MEELEDQPRSLPPENESQEGNVSDETESSSKDRRRDSEKEAKVKVKECRGKIETLNNFVEHLERLEEARKSGGTIPLGAASHGSRDGESLDVGALYRDWETFQQRFFIHNPTIFFNNSTRDVLLKYYLSSRARRGFCHHMTSRALKAIRDLNKQEDEEGEREEAKGKGKPKSKSPFSSDEQDEEGADLLHGLLNDTMHYVEEAEAKDDLTRELRPPPLVEPGYGISKEFSINKSNVCVFLKPQIVLQSERDKDSSLVITAVRGRLQNYSVRDEALDDDSINERALYRNFASLDGLQVFHPTAECSSFLRPDLGQFGFAFVPLETLIASSAPSRDFDRVVPLTDASMQYDKFNKVSVLYSMSAATCDFPLTLFPNFSFSFVCMTSQDQ